MEYVVKIYDGTHKGEAWFPKEFIVHYESDYNNEAFKRLRSDIARRYVARDFFTARFLLVFLFRS